METMHCRICDNSELLPILDLGTQAITSVFPGRADAKVPEIPLELVKCSPAGCGLVQLRHSANLDDMYGSGSYGYVSSIRPYMVDHLHGKVRKVLDHVELARGDLVVDIGSNDSTLLRGYPTGRFDLIGFDPNGEQFRDEYPPGIDLVSDYFTKAAFESVHGGRKAKVVTSIAMFYDLPRPMDVMRDIYEILDDDGVWVSEQSYLPSMLAAGAYDVVCHEHLEYYAFRQFEWMAERVGFTIVDAEITPVYGGSLSITMAKKPNRYPVAEHNLAHIRLWEAGLALDTMAPFEAFANRATGHRQALREFLDTSRAAGRLTLGYGASTKGNVILQYCDVTTNDLPCIGEVNPGKSGSYTPGTLIPIVSEEQAHEMKPDQLLVLPWIFRDGFLDRERQFMDTGGKLVFPLPKLEVV